MGIGMGYIAKGLTSEMDNLRRQKREDERLDIEKNRETREQTTFENQQEDRETFDKPMKRYGLQKAQRDDELGALEAEIKKNDMEALKKVQGARDQATQMKAAQEVAELEAKNAGLIYKAYKLRGGKAAARLLNQMRGSEVNNAADFVEYVDPKTKKKMIKVVDAEGNVVTEDGQPMVMDADELEKVFGVKAEKGSFNESERGVLDTRTGKFKAHGPGVAKGGTPSNAAKEQAELEAQGYPRPMARAIAYNLVEKIQDPMGMGTVWRDKSNNQIVASTDNEGKLTKGPGWERLMSSGSAVPPPAQRKAGQIFDTPLGKMKWTGTGWVPAQ